MWQKYFDKTFLINLKHRTDRLEETLAHFEEYDVDCSVFEATAHEKGYFGLVLTMKSLFKHCLDEGYNKVLVLEDDCRFVVAPNELDYTMCQCVNDLANINWDLFYLGLQQVRQFRRWVTPNILPVDCGYSTHATAYSRRAMEFYINTYVDEPIDNLFVREFQPYNTSYCSYPLLATQADTYSDIAQDRPNWDRYIQDSYAKSVREILSLRTKK